MKPIDKDFFLLEKPWYPGILDKLFKDVIDNYKKHVVQAVKDYTVEHSLKQLS